MTTLGIPYVEKVQLVYQPGIPAQLPGDPGDGGGFFDDRNAQYTRENNAGEASLSPRVAIGAKNRTLGPILGIAIAPDSAIADCDLWLGDQALANRRRVSVGCPYIGSLDGIEDLIVTLPRVLPLPYALNDDALTIAQWKVQNKVYDAQPTSLVKTFLGAPTEVIFHAAPLRLELWRGAIPPVAVRRAAYNCELLYSMANAAAGFSRLWMFTHGRREIDVIVDATAAGGSQIVTVKGYDQRFDKNFTADTYRGKIPNTLAVVPLAAAGTYRATFTEPFDLFSVEVIADVGAALGMINIVARDR